MITELTKEQQLLLPVYAKKWLDIGLCTEPSNRALAETGIRECYKIGGIQPPKEIIWCESPLSMYLTKSAIEELSKKRAVRASVRASVWDSAGDSVGDSVGASVRASVRASVGASVGASLRDSVGASVWDSLRASARDSVWASVRASLRASLRDSARDSVRDSVWDSVWASARDSVRDSVWDSVYGQHDASWLGAYEYYKEVLGLNKETVKLRGLWKLALSTGWVLPLKDICLMSERHNICRLKEGAIHNDKGPAIQYPDGFSIYALNGVRVPEMIVDTPADKLDPMLIMKEKNAEVRREIVRKIGIERVCQKLDTDSIDKWNGYELIALKIPDMTRPAVYLKMINPSIGVYHLEGVPPEITTCQQALSWRIGGKEWNPDQLT